MKAVSEEIKAMILVNALLVGVYLFFNWGEYSVLNSFELRQPWQVMSVSSNFPWYFTAASSHAESGAIFSLIYYNYPLAIFLMTVLVNLYFIFRLQRAKGINH